MTNCLLPNPKQEEMSYTGDVLRVHLSEASRLTGGREQILGMISVDVGFEAPAVSRTRLPT